jgi:hypothetical protein
MRIINQGIFTLEIDGTVACMNFNPIDPKYPYTLVEASYQREVDFLHRVSKYDWAPKEIHVQNSDRKIYFKWHNNTCENYMPDNWKEQLERIALDLHSERIYKPNFYPKCFYTDDDDKLHTYTFYSSSNYIEQPISMDFYKPILNEDRLQVVEQLSVDGKLDMKWLIERAFNDYIKWPGDPLPDIYKKVYG